MLQPPYSLFPGVPGSRRSSSSGQESSLGPRPGPGSLVTPSLLHSTPNKTAVPSIHGNTIVHSSIILVIF